MLRLSGLDNFYYLPMLHDMRYKGHRLSEIIRNTYHRDPLNGDIYMYMSRDRRTIRLFQYKHHAYDLHERTFSNEYRFKKVPQFGIMPQVKKLP